MTTVERFDDATATWIEITDYGSFKITNGVSDVHVAPTSQLQLPRTSEVSAGTRIRITEPSGVVFEGNVVRTKPRSQSAMRVDAEHDAYGLFEENISLSVSGTDEGVLQAALNAAGGSWTLAYSGTATSLGDTYEVEGRSVKRVFRDMTDRVGRVWWVGVDHTIHVQPLGFRGTFASVDTSQDDAVVTEYTPDDVDTVVNDVTVVGTGGEKVTGGAEDSASISDYGRQPERVNVSYITTQGEANSYASALLNPEPDSSATARLGASVGNVAAPLPNYTLDITDAQGVGLDDELVIEKQTVTQGSAEVELGEGAGVNIAKFNRREKSKEDVTEPGSVYNSDRIADGAIESSKLVDDAVIESKLQDLSVTLNKVDFDAIDETKIQDDAVRTPQLFAGAVTAEKLDTELARAERLLAGEIEALDIATNTLTANQIDTLDLDTQDLFIGADAADGIEFNIDPTYNWVEMIPSSDGAVCSIGSSSRRFSSISTVAMSASGIILGGKDDRTSPLSIAEFAPSGTTDEVYITTDGDGNARVIPADDNTVFLGDTFTAFETANVYTVNADTVVPKDGSNTGNVGVTGNYWNGMRSNAYFEESPIPEGDARSSIDLAELRDSDWYNPPEYVAEGTRAKQGTAEGGLSTSSIGDGTEAGVEIGTIVNYVFEVAKKQQEVIDEQAERLDSLEDRLSALEAQGDPNA